MEHIACDENGYHNLSKCTWEDEEAKSYNADGTLTPFGLALWLDDEGGVFSFIQGRGSSDLIEAGVDAIIARKCESAMAALLDELERIGAVL